MCFNKEMTLGFTLISVICGCWIASGMHMWANLESWRRVRIAACFFYFAIMEGLQFVQYLVLDQCQNKLNIFMTALGWFHICWQPLFSNIAMSAVDSNNVGVNNKKREFTWRFVFKLCFVCGILMAARMVIPMVLNGYTNDDYLVMCNQDIEGVCPNTTELDLAKQGLRNPTCAYQGNFHVGWTFNMLKPSYPFPNVATHLINMFILPFLMGCRFQAIVLFFSGPGISMWFPARDGERAAIWCFLSISETAITLFSQLYILKGGLPFFRKKRSE